MPIKFSPVFQITASLANNLMRIEAARQKAFYLPLNAVVLKSLRETARLYTTHYSTMIEGNQLDPEQIRFVLEYKGHFPGREREEREIKGYYAALTQIEQWVTEQALLDEQKIKTLHAMVMGDGRIKTRPTPYRDGQNVIRDSQSGLIVYMPPEAKDVPKLMGALVKWLSSSNNLPCPLVAGIAHYQFAIIHPYYDGNGRTARLLTTFLLHSGGYDLKGLYQLEEYYAQQLGNYYRAISIGPSHNYYFGRAEADITSWLEYFIEGMATSFEKVVKRMQEAENKQQSDQAVSIRSLDAKQRKVLGLFQNYEKVTSNQIGEMFGFKARTSSQLCKKWVEQGFLKVVDPSNKGRKYALSHQYKDLILANKLLD